MFTPAETDLLLVVDVQNDFLPGGALAVADGDAVVGPCRDLATRFRHVVLTQDWHPAGHVSFATSHPGGQVLDTVALPDGRSQILWPEHCLQGSHGAALAPGLDIPHAELVIRKGYRPDLDSYSAFMEADGRTATGLAGYLRERGLRRVIVCGLATDFCAGWSAIDAAKAGFDTWLVTDATRGIDAHGSMERAFADMAAAGVTQVSLSDLASEHQDGFGPAPKRRRSRNTNQSGSRNAPPVAWAWPLP